MFKWVRNWSWTATGTMLISLAVSVVLILLSATSSPLEFWRNVVVAVFLAVIGLVVAVKLSAEQHQRDKAQAEMITGGDNFCYMSADHDSLKNNINHIPLWIDSTGLLLNLAWFISPADSTPGHTDARYHYLEQRGQVALARGAIEVIHKEHVALTGALPIDEVLSWRIEFSARNGGWKQYLTLSRTDSGLVQTSKVIHNDGRTLWPPEATP